MIHSPRPAWLKQPPNKIDLVFFDFETTGGNPHNSSIIEIGAVKFSDGNEVGRFETLVKPKHSISSIVQKITGINNHMLEKAPQIEDVFEDFILFIGDAVLVSHGTAADIAFIEYYKEKLLKKAFTNFFLCTHLLASNFLPDLPSKSLTGVAEYFNFENKYAHTALGDAITTEYIFWKLYEIGVQQDFVTCEDLFKIQGDQESMQKLGLGFDPALLHNAPPMSGLFFLLSSGHEISYLSASSNLKKSLVSILDLAKENKEFSKILVDASGFKIERTSNFMNALIQEKNELKKLSLSFDPRILQKRSNKFLQIFVPPDLLKYILRNADKFEFNIPRDYTSSFDEKDNVNFTDDYIDITDDTKKSQTDVKHTKKILNFIKTKKYKLNRHIKSDRSILNNKYIHYGYLHEGAGYAFGPFQNADETAAIIEELLKKYPFDDGTLPLPIRCDHLFSIVETLNTIENSLYSLKSGLCVISNNDFKEFEVFVIAKGQIIKKLHLPFENTEKLKSSRYFTRLFESSYDDIKNTKSPLFFTDNICSNIELFSYWLTEKHGEGEWIEFKELESLFDPELLK